MGAATAASRASEIDSDEMEGRMLTLLANSSRVLSSKLHAILDNPASADTFIPTLQDGLQRLQAIGEQHNSTLTAAKFDRLQALLMSTTAVTSADIADQFRLMATLAATGNCVLADPSQFTLMAQERPPSGVFARTLPGVGSTIFLPCFHESSVPGFIGHWTLLTIKGPSGKGKSKTGFTVSMFDPLAGANACYAFCLFSVSCVRAVILHSSLTPRTLAGPVRPEHVDAVHSYQLHLQASSILPSTVALTPITSVAGTPLQTPGDVTCGIWVMREVINQVSLCAKAPSTMLRDAGPQAVRAVMVLTAALDGGDVDELRNFAQTLFRPEVAMSSVALSLALCVLYRALCVFSRALCVLSRAPCVLYRALCVFPRALCVLSRALCVFSRALCVLSRALCVLYRALCVLSRALCVLYRALCVLYRALCVLSRALCLYCMPGLAPRHPPLQASQATVTGHPPSPASTTAAAASLPKVFTAPTTWGPKAPGRVLCKVKGDGDCMFNAIGAMWPDMDPSQLRTICIACMRLCANQPLPGKPLSIRDMSSHEADWDNHLWQLQTRSEPDVAALAMLSHMTKLPITLVYDDPTRSPSTEASPDPGVDWHPWRDGEVNAGHIVLLYSGTHYDALLLHADLQDLRPPTPTVDCVAVLENGVQELPSLNPVGWYHLKAEDPKAPSTVQVRCVCCQSALYNPGIVCFLTLLHQLTQHVGRRLRISRRRGRNTNGASPPCND